jgi:hypothetical protein
MGMILGNPECILKLTGSHSSTVQYRKNADDLYFCHLRCSLLPEPHLSCYVHKLSQRSIYTVFVYNVHRCSVKEAKRIIFYISVKILK